MTKKKSNSAKVLTPGEAQANLEKKLNPVLNDVIEQVNYRIQKSTEFPVSINVLSEINDVLQQGGDSYSRLDSEFSRKCLMHRVVSAYSLKGWDVQEDRKKGSVKIGAYLFNISSG